MKEVAGSVQCHVSLIAESTHRTWQDSTSEEVVGYPPLLGNRLLVFYGFNKDCSQGSLRKPSLDHGLAGGFMELRGRGGGL